MNPPSATIWVVDDDPAARRLVSAAFSALLPVPVATFASAPEAVAHLAGHGAPAVVVTDYSMPDMNGVELSAAVKQASPATRVVVLSAVDVQLVDQGTVDLWLTKPVRPSVLAATIKGLLPAGEREPAGPAGGSPAAVGAMTSAPMLALKARYAGYLREVAGSIPRMAAAADLRPLRELLHQLIGTAASYGFTEVSDAAGALRAALIEHERAGADSAPAGEPEAHRSPAVDGKAEAAQGGAPSGAEDAGTGPVPVERPGDRGAGPSGASSTTEGDRPGSPPARAPAALGPLEQLAGGSPVAANLETLVTALRRA